MKERLRGNLDMLVLSVLEERPLHGYGVVRALRERSGGVFDLPEGSVYPSLHRLEESGLLQSEWEQVDGRRRRVYRATAAGHTAAAAERREWELFRGAVELVLEGSA
jgi:DNA-binding PadR family transcriptional regulator